MHLKEKDKLVNSFPILLKYEVEKVYEVLTFKDTTSFSANFITVSLKEEILQFPYRVYFDEPDELAESSLTTLQKTILNCILLRHYDGFVRQRRLEQLVTRTEYWILPFTFQLAGEYVYEILEVLDKHINKRTLESYCIFRTENAKHFKRTEERMISYWNEYYRHSGSPMLSNYIGQQLFDRIKKAGGNASFQTTYAMT